MARAGRSPLVAIINYFMTVPMADARAALDAAEAIVAARGTAPTKIEVPSGAVRRRRAAKPVPAAAATTAPSAPAAEAPAPAAPAPARRRGRPAKAKTASVLPMTPGTSTAPSSAADGPVRRRRPSVDVPGQPAVTAPPVTTAVMAVTPLPEQDEDGEPDPAAEV